MNAPVASAPTDGVVSRIGPNSVLQLVPLLDEALGSEERQRLMLLSGLDELPERRRPHGRGAGGMPASGGARHHPALAPALTRCAGERTGDYIIRIAFQSLHFACCATLPPWLSAPLLANVIEKHAWTFAGSGTFKRALTASAGVRTCGQSSGERRTI
jgi:divinyl protochlorophyllide a 8-vinyl-reductase